MRLKEIRDRRKKRVALLALLVVLAVFSVVRVLRKPKEEVIEWKNYALIGKQNVFIIYEKKLSFLIPLDIYMTKEFKIEDYISKEKYSELLHTLNDVLPVKLDNYRIAGKKMEININTEHQITIPQVNENSKKYILTSALNEVFTKLYYEKEELELLKPEEIIIDVLNANGRTGYAGKTGNLINEKFGYKYNSANYEELSEYSYVINNSLSEEQLKELVLNLNEKYVRIREKGSLPTLANAVVILGKESTGLLNIFVMRKDSYDSETYNKLKKLGYKNVRRVKGEKAITENVLEYNKEDYYIAYKISKLIGIKNLTENNELKNRINILLK